MKIKVTHNFFGTELSREFTDTAKALEWMQVLCANEVRFEVTRTKA